MDILKKSEKELQFNVRGRHTTVYPVSLPPLLDRKIMEAAVARFQYLVAEGLQKVWDSRAERELDSKNLVFDPRVSLESHMSAASNTPTIGAPANQGASVGFWANIFSIITRR
jgi:hypothetical protein